MINARALVEQRKQLEDLWVDNTKHGLLLVNGIRDHLACCYSHKQIWDNYNKLAEECNKLEQEARWELDRVRLVKSSLKRELSPDLRHRLGKAELRNKLTEYTWDVARLPRQALYALENRPECGSLPVKQRTNQ